MSSISIANVDELESILREHKEDAEVKKKLGAVYHVLSEIDAEILEEFRAAFIDYQLSLHHRAYRSGFCACLKQYMDEMKMQHGSL